MKLYAIRRRDPEGGSFVWKQLYLSPEVAAKRTTRLVKLYNLTEAELDIVEFCVAAAPVELLMAVCADIQARKYAKRG